MSNIDFIFSQSAIFFRSKDMTREIVKLHNLKYLRKISYLMPITINVTKTVVPVGCTYLHLLYLKWMGHTLPIKFKFYLIFFFVNSRLSNYTL